MIGAKWDIEEYTLTVSDIVCTIESVKPKEID
jgi:hypothetical protein